MDIDEGGNSTGKPVVSRSGSSRKGLSWDEEVIAEHDKLRGTRTKITEPKTPFRASSPTRDMDTSNVEAFSLENADPRLHSAISTHTHPGVHPHFGIPSSPNDGAFAASSTTMGDSTILDIHDAESGIADRDGFNQKRKSHYSKEAVFLHHAKEILQAEAGNDDDDEEMN
jgi:Protein phosphatase inhibitor 2 (IPP-2)